MAPPDLFASSDTGYFLFVAVVTVLCIFLVEAHRRTKPGRAWALIRKSEQMAIASGVRIVFYKAWAFALSGFVAGVAGRAVGRTVRPARCLGVPDDELDRDFHRHAAGRHTTSGSAPFLGGLLTRFIPALLIDLNVNTNVGFMLFGAALLFALRDPIGLGGQLHDSGRTALREFRAQRAP